MFQTIKIIKDKQSENFMMLIMMIWNYYQLLSDISGHNSLLEGGGGGLGEQQYIADA